MNAPPVSLRCLPVNPKPRPTMTFAEMCRAEGHIGTVWPAKQRRPTPPKGGITERLLAYVDANDWQRVGTVAKGIKVTQQAINYRIKYLVNKGRIQREYRWIDGNKVSFIRGNPERAGE